MPVQKQNKKPRAKNPDTKDVKRKANHRVRVLNRYLERTFSRSLNRYTYGPEDQLPQILLKLVANNGTALLAVKKVSQYIYANGFNDIEFGKMKVNQKKTANQVLKELSYYAAIFEGFSLYVRRNPLGGIADIDSGRFELTRPREDGSIIFNNSYGTDKYTSRADVRHPAFMGLQISPEQLRKNINEYDDAGEIMYVFQESPFSTNFPIPSWFSGEFDVRSGSEFQAYDLETIVNGFLSSVMITFLGDIDDETEDDNGKTEWDYYLEELKTFTGQLKGDDGLSKRGRVAAFNVGSKGEAPVVETLSLEKVITASIAKREHIDKNVSMLFNVFPVLIGFEITAVLGDDKAMSNASSELARSVIDKQEMISNAFSELFPGRDTSISVYRPYQYIPDKILDDLDSNERRKLVNYPEKAIELKDEKQIILDRLNSLSPLLAAEIVKRMPSDKLFELIGITVDNIENPSGTDPGQNNGQ